MSHQNRQQTNFHVPTLIAKKRDGNALSNEEIEYLVEIISNKNIDDAQIGALLMAIRLKDMSDEETAQLTRSMTDSGFKFSWPEEWRHLVVDKHSTGGVGDKVTLVLTPALAACGLKVPTITGRGLSHTGGTLDKLESIPGFSCSLPAEKISAMVADFGCCITGQTEDIAPADRVLYKIRDVTATVDSVPLITGSILSKKVAESPAALVIDVKLGKGAIMSDESYMTKLAHSLVSVSNLQGVKTTALLSRMDSPLGNMVGNALEIAEVIECLHGGGPRPLVNLIHQLGGHLLHNTKLATSPSDGADKIRLVLEQGKAMQKFESLLEAQGVDKKTVEALCAKDADVFNVLPKAKINTKVPATESGYIVELDALTIAHVSMTLGAGRRNTQDKIDYAVGIQLLRHVGDFINKGDHVFNVHHNLPLATDSVSKLQSAIKVDAIKPDDNLINNLVVEAITG